MSTLLSIGRDVQGYEMYATPVCKDIFSATIAATTDTTLTVPSNFQNWIAVITVEPSKTVWFALNTAAAAPAGATFASSSSELIGYGFPLNNSKKVNAGDVLHFFSETGTANMSVALYAIS